MGTKTVYILKRTRRPSGRTSRVGVWVKRATAERHLEECEKWASFFYRPERRPDYEIIEEERNV